MKRIWMIGLAAAAMASIGAGGCDENERLAEYAQNSVNQQARQNEQIARQNLEVTRQNQQVAEAAQKLVDADSQARLEMAKAQNNLQQESHTERVLLDQQRQDLEADRRQLARERYWDPLISQTIAGCGLLLACLLPLVACLYLLRHLQSSSGDETVLNELLVSELVSERPLLLPPASETPPALEQPASPPGAKALDEEDLGPPPF